MVILLEYFYGMSEANGTEPSKRKYLKTSLTLPEGLADDPEVKRAMDSRYIRTFSDYVTRLVLDDLEKASPAAVESQAEGSGS
jgi:hypothetical protein